MNNEISNERLEEIVDFVESFGRHPKLHECAAMAKELLALRKAREGWQLVPIEPTEAMMLNESDCQHHAWDDANYPMRESRRIIWKHMIQAAPEVE